MAWPMSEQAETQYAQGRAAEVSKIGRECLRVLIELGISVPDETLLDYINCHTSGPYILSTLHTLKMLVIIIIIIIIKINI